MGFIRLHGRNEGIASAGDDSEPPPTLRHLHRTGSGGDELEFPSPDLHCIENGEDAGSNLN
jgi:hypothetical protein